MINESSACLTVFVKTCDFLARFVFFGIAAACHNNASAGVFAPLYVEIFESFVIDSLDDIDKIRFKKRQNNLSFGVAEAAVVLDNLCAVACEHKPEVQTALERTVFCAHRLYCREENFLHTFLGDFLCIIRIGRDCTHSARVQALVVVESALVVHRRNHRLYGFSVRERKNGYLNAAHKLLDNNFRAALSELLVNHHRLNRVLGFLEILRDDNALSERKTVALDNRGILILRLDVSNCLVRVREGFISRRGDIVLLHQPFGESLASLENRGIRARTERLETALVQPVHKSHYQRVVGRYKNIVGLQFLCERANSVKVGCLYGETLGDARNSAVSGCAVQLVNLRGFFESRSDCVFTTAAAYY